jgi:hypothetical protein
MPGHAAREAGVEEEGLHLAAASASTNLQEPKMLQFLGEFAHPNVLA